VLVNQKESIMSLNRRSFIKKAAAGVALSALPGMKLLAAGNTSVFSKAESKLPSLQFDVIVVGAGPSGIPAAIAAAREGVKVALIEEDMSVGGAPVDMYVTYLCGAPRIGVFNEVMQSLNNHHSLGVSPSPTLGRWLWDNKNHWWLPSSFSSVLHAMIAAEKNITLMCGTPVVDAIFSEKGNRTVVSGVKVMRMGILQEIKAPVTIDATGTGLVAAQAGCEYFFGSDAKSDFNESIGLEKSDGRVQPCTLMYISQRTKSSVEFPKEFFRTGVLDNDTPKWVPQQSAHEFREKDTGIYLHWGATIPCHDTTDPVQVAESHRLAYNKLAPQLNALHEAGYATHVAPKIGIRECRRIRGEYVLTVDDILNKVMPDDKVADAWYSLDAWGMNISEKIKNGVGPYGIPYRSLIPRNTEGLLTAGRIISGTRLAMSSYRVQPICGTIGEAAGTAAAMAVKNKTALRNIEIRSLQNRLQEKGLFDWYRNIGMKVNNMPWNQ
jgi:hypothetical protein